MKSIKVLEGKRKILLSAPHSKLHRRPNLVGKYKAGEANTEYIVKEACKRIGSFGIYADDKLDYDPNYHALSINDYKREIKRLVNEEKIERFIDIHGIDKGYEVDFLIYYKTKFTNSIRLANDLVKYIDKGNLRGANILIYRLPRIAGESISGFVASKLRIPAVQIEIARYIREDKKLLNSLIDNLTEYINS